MPDGPSIPLNRSEMLRRRALRSKYRFKLYSWEEMCWFNAHPIEWDEECALNGLGEKLSGAGPNNRRRMGRRMPA
jgi:hypothetical protein